MMRRTPMQRGTSVLKRTEMRKRLRKPARTDAMRKFMDGVASMGCVVCRNLGYGSTPAELHHPRFGAGAGQKAPDSDVIPLCSNHHRLGGYGVAFHAGREVFEQRYGTEKQLLEQTRRETAARKMK